MMKTRHQLLSLLTCMFSATVALAQVPETISYQGRVTVSGTNFTGTGQFKFALVDQGRPISTRKATATVGIGSVLGNIIHVVVTDGGKNYPAVPLVRAIDPLHSGSGASLTATVAGGQVTGVTINSGGHDYSAQTYIDIAAPPAQSSYVTFWSNDGTSTQGSEPAAAVALPIDQGLFTAFLGDTALTNMNPLPASVFTNAEAQLRIWFNDGVQGFSQLSPDHPLGAVGYAMMAAGLPAGAVTAQNIAAGAINGSHLAAGSITTSHLVAGSVTSSQLAAGAVTATNLAPGVLNHLDAPDGSPTNALTVNGTGLVGIGTNAPQAGLHITSSQSYLAPSVQSMIVGGQGRYTNLCPVSCLAVNNGLLAVGAGDYERGITLISITNPAVPLFRWSVRDGENGYTNMWVVGGIALSGNLLAFSAPYNDQVTLVNVSNPYAPVKLAELRDGVGAFDNLAWPQDLLLSNNLLIIVARNDAAVTLVNVANPANPTLAGFIKNGVYGFTNLQQPGALARQGNLLAITSSTGTDDPEGHAVTLADISNPASPMLRSVLKPTGSVFTNLFFNSSVAFSGNILAIASGWPNHCVTLVNVSNPANPILLATIKQGQTGFEDFYWPNRLRFQGNLLWISSGALGSASVLRAVDVSSPAAPVLKTVLREGTGGFHPLGGIRELAFSDNTLVVGSEGAVTLLDTTTTAAAGLAAQDWVGIGTTQPRAPLHVMGNLLVEDANFIELRATHVQMGDSSATGTNATAMGVSTASGGYSTAMGSSTASGDYSTAMGRSEASGINATAMGYSEASGEGATAMGASQASGRYATASGTSEANYEGSVAIGEHAVASGWASVALGGFHPQATGHYAVAIGYWCEANGDSSFALGRDAKANHQGAFVWADSPDVYSSQPFASTTNNQFLIRASGGVGINTTNPATALDVKGTITATGIRAGVNGTVQSRVQFGTATVGTGVAGANVYTITFPNAFSSAPRVLVTVRGDDRSDTFAISTRGVNTTSFKVSIVRVDANLGWGQDLRVDWYAIE